MKLLAIAIAASAVCFGQGDDEKAKVKDLMGKVEGIRDLKFKEDVGVGLYTKDELGAFLKKEFDREMPEYKAHVMEKVGAQFGIFPKKFDVMKAYLEMMTEQIAGFYHPRSKMLKLIKNDNPMAAMMQDMYTAHELTHALQDQSYDLENWRYTDHLDNSDLSTAMQCVTEGEASLVMYQFQFKGQYKSMKGMLTSRSSLRRPDSKYPKYLTETLIVPYADGTKFVDAVWTKNKNDGLNGLYENPPLSTEQIMHPDKYINKSDYPIDIEFKYSKINEIVGKDKWKRIDNDVWGELGMGIMLEEVIGKGSSKEATKASEGWGGDRYLAYENREDGTILSIWYTTWDSEDDAAEFFNAYKKGLTKKYKDWKEGTSDEDHFALEGDSYDAHMVKEGQDVIIVENVGKGAFEEVLKGVKANTKKEKMTKIRKTKTVIA